MVAHLVSFSLKVVMVTTSSWTDIFLTAVQDNRNFLSSLLDILIDFNFKMVKCLPLDYMTLNNIPVVFRFLLITVIYYEVIGLCIVILGSRGEKRTIRYSKYCLWVFFMPYETVQLNWTWCTCLYIILFGFIIQTNNKSNIA